jgi:hypothetical protein
MLSSAQFATPISKAEHGFRPKQLSLVLVGDEARHDANKPEETVRRTKIKDATN